MQKKHTPLDKRLIRHILDEVRLTSSVNLKLLSEETGLTPNTLYQKVLGLKQETGVLRYKRYGDMLVVDLWERQPGGDKRKGKYFAQVVPKTGRGKLFLTVKAIDEMEARDKLKSDFSVKEILSIRYVDEAFRSNTKGEPQWN